MTNVTAPSSADPYALSAEFFDVLSVPYWETVGPGLSAALTSIDPAAGPVLDIGAGTGLSVAFLTEQIPDAEILAVEPSPAMRAALASRVIATPGLDKRVTILAGQIEDADLPASLSGVLMIGVIGYLDAPARQALWQQLAERLQAGAPAVVTVMAVTEPTVVTRAKVASRALGRASYEVWMAGEPAGPGRMHWQLTYQVVRDGTVEREFTADHEWIALSTEEVAAEAAEHDFAVSAIAEQTVVLRRIGAQKQQPRR